MLVREARSGRPHATGILPITPLDPQSDVEGGLEALRKAGIASVSLVADPMWCPDPSVLRGAFDICQRFREHYFVDRDAPVRYHKRHRRRLSEARRAGTVAELQLADHLGRWHELYGQNVANRGISEPFTAAYFEQLSTLPTLRTIAVLVGDEIVTMTLWLQHEDTLYLHDSASDQRGFRDIGSICGARARDRADDALALCAPRRLRRRGRRAAGRPGDVPARLLERVGLQLVLQLDPDGARATATDRTLR